MQKGLLIILVTICLLLNAPSIVAFEQEVTESHRIRHEYTFSAEEVVIILLEHLKSNLIPLPEGDMHYSGFKYRPTFSNDGEDTELIIIYFLQTIK